VERSLVGGKGRGRAGGKEKDGSRELHGVVKDLVLATSLCNNVFG